MNIIITGAGKGIGYETALKLSQDPTHTIVAISRNIDALEGRSSNLIPLAYDLSRLPDPEFVQRLVALLHGRVDVLINNAGLLINKPYPEYSMADFEGLMTVNIKVPHLLIQSLLPHFARPSHILNVSSMGGFQGSVKFPGLALYSAFKGALCTLTECLAEELKPQGVAVNALCLGAVQTEMLLQAFPGYQAPTTAREMGAFIAEFSEHGAKLFNGKILPVANSTP